MKRNRGLSSVFGLLLVFSAVAVAQTTTYIVTDLGTLGGTFSSGGIVNDRGQVASGSTLTSDSVVHAFIWSNGTKTDLFTLGGPNSYANAISNNDAVVGSSDISTSSGNPILCYMWGSTANQCHAFIWQHDAMTDVGTLGGLNSAVPAIGINSRGQVVGGAETIDSDPFNPGFQIFHAFLWDPHFTYGTLMTDLGTLGGLRSMASSINDLGWSVGQSEITSTPQSYCGGCIPVHAFLWRGAMIDLETLPGGHLSNAQVISNSGLIVGGSSLPGDVHGHAVLWQGGKIKDLGTLPGDTDSGASGVNDKGQVVGGSWNESGSVGFVWQNGAMSDLNTLIPSSSDLYLVWAFQINARGQINATAVTSTGEMHAVLLTPTVGSTPHTSRRLTLNGNVRKLLQRQMPKSKGWPIIQQ